MFLLLGFTFTLKNGINTYTKRGDVNDYIYYFAYCFSHNKA